MLNQSAFKKACEAVKGNGEKLAEKIHSLGLMALEHTAEHGDPVYANMLLENMPKGQKKQALKAWFLRFGKLASVKDQDQLKYKKIKDYNFGQSKIEAENNPYWTIESEKPAHKILQELDAKQLMILALTRAAKQATEVTENGGVVAHFEVMQQVAEVLGVELTIKEVQ